MRRLELQLFQSTIARRLILAIGVAVTRGALKRGRKAQVPPAFFFSVALVAERTHPGRSTRATERISIAVL